MTDKSQELLLGLSVLPPERGDDLQYNDQDFLDALAIYESSKENIISLVGSEDFKTIYMTLNRDIKTESLQRQRIFLEQILDKIEEVYDFRFPFKIEFNNRDDLKNGYDFIEFLEYDNVDFLASIWKHLQNNLVVFNIEEFSQKNGNKIIKEIEEQLSIKRQSPLVSLFLRTYYKDGIIKWFIKKSIQSRFEITITNLEREEEKNV